MTGLRQRPVPHPAVAAAKPFDVGDDVGFRGVVELTPLVAHGFTRNRVWPNSTVSPFSTSTLLIVPRHSALMLLKTFIASMMQTSVSSSTCDPTCTNGL